MVLYVILTRNIINIGGAEIYTRNKLVYNTDKYETLIISTSHGTVYIEELKQFADSVVEELDIDPFFYSAQQRNKILRKIKKLLPEKKQFEDIIIETQTIQLSLWGELIAKMINGRCFCLLALDRFPLLSQSTCSFFKYKLSRDELAGISTESLPMLFKNNYTVPLNKCNKLSFFCANSIEDVSSSFCINRDCYDIVIGTLTRLEKVCVHFILDEVLEFARNNSNKRILFIFFGGSENKAIERKIISRMSIYKNLTFILSGIIYPVPLSEINKIDLFINVAGAARATRKKGIPTLSIELETGKPLGFLGYNTNSTQYKTDNNTYVEDSISKVLNQVFIENKYSLSDIKSKLGPIEENNIDFSSHEIFIQSSIKTYKKEYYDFNNYKVSSFWKTIITVLYSLLGIKLLKKSMKIYRICFKKG